MREGRLDRRRLETRDYLTFRTRLVRDLGASSPDGLSAQQQALALECAFKLAVLDALKRWALTRGVMRRGHLTSALAAHYLAWSNSLRLDLLALGLERRHAGSLNVLEMLRAGGGE